jgi:spermidine synthase
VLAAFMAGLGLGNLLAARFGDSARRPLVVCAATDAVIALAGLAVVLLLPTFGAVLVPWLRPLADRPWLLNLSRLALAWVVLLVPATAMGATLPLMTRALTTVDREFGPVLGRPMDGTPRAG